MNYHFNLKSDIYLDGPEMMIEARIISVEQLSRDVKAFTVVPVNGTCLPAAEPGAHISIYLPNGLTRQYSLCEETDGTRYEFAVKHVRQSRGGSRYMHEGLAQGDTIAISAPRNNFVLGRHAHTLLIAGGIGITPLVAMARKLVADGTSFVLHYFCRDADAPFKDFVDKLAPGRAVRHVGLNPAAKADKLDELIAKDTPSGTHIYVCGPQPLMDQTVKFASHKPGVAAVHLERFTASANAAKHVDRDFAVKLARSGKLLEVPADLSLLSVLTAAGVNLSSSCREGLCGSCVTGVLSGIPDHRDSFLTDEERRAGQEICPCVSRAHTSELVLDL